MIYDCTHHMIGLAFTLFWLINLDKWPANLTIITPQHMWWDAPKWPKFFLQHNTPKNYKILFPEIHINFSCFEDDGKREERNVGAGRCSKMESIKAVTAKLQQPSVNRGLCCCTAVVGTAHTAPNSLPNRLEAPPVKVSLS